MVNNALVLSLDLSWDINCFTLIKFLDANVTV